MFDWCVHGKHAKGGCPGKYQKFTFVKKPGRTSETTVQMLDEWVECGCKCHKGKK